MRRTRPTACALLAALIGLAAACAERATDRPLTIAIPRDGGPLNPYSGASDYLLSFIYDKLFEPSPYVNDPHPGLARDAVLENDTTWLVTLRSGVRWHDGRPFTAADVRFTYEYYRDGPPTRFGHHVSDVPRIDRVEIVDPLTLRFHCGHPCPLLRRVTFADLPVIPRHIWEGVAEPPRYTGLPVGTGPYRLIEYRPDRHYRMVANEDYHGGPPRVPELLFAVLGDASATFLALESGQVDASARKLPPELVNGFDAGDGVRVVSTHALSIAELRPNYRKAPFDDGRFRRALSLALDRQAIVDRVLLGYGRPGVRGYPHPDAPWTDPSLSTPYDAAHAAALLDSLEIRDRDGDGIRETPGGAPLRFELLVNAGEAASVRVAELLAAQLRTVGFELRVRTLEATALSQYASAREYDLFISEIGPHGVADPDQFIMSHRSGYLWDPALPFPELDDLFESWKATRTVADRQVASHALQRLFNERPTSIALYYPEEHWAYRPAAWDGWIASPGYGIVHKWSFLPHDTATQ